jgi:hypothetical protein
MTVLKDIDQNLKGHGYYQSESKYLRGMFDPLAFICSGTNEGRG